MGIAREHSTASQKPVPNAHEIRPSRSKRFKFVVGLLVASVALFSAEVLARILTSAEAETRFRQINQIVLFLGTQESDLMLEPDPERFWKFRPNVSIQDPKNEFWQGIVSNSLGFRNAEFELARSTESLRIVCFGDSSTFGIGTPVQDTWPSQLQDRLRRLSKLSTCSKIEVINAGVPGYSSYQGLQHMRQEVKRLAPDIVLASYANNDFWHWDQTTDLDHAKQFSRQDLGGFVRKSRLVQIMDRCLRTFTSESAKNNLTAPSPNQMWARAATANYVRPVNQWTRRVPLGDFRRNINDMANLCKASSIPLILVKWPDQAQASGAWSPRIEYHDVLEEVAEQRGLLVADVVGEFQRKQNWSVDTYIPNDIVHVNRDGNQLAATAAFDAIYATLTAGSASTEVTN